MLPIFESTIQLLSPCITCQRQTRIRKRFSTCASSFQCTNDQENLTEIESDLLHLTFFMNRFSSDPVFDFRSQNHHFVSNRRLFNAGNGQLHGRVTSSAPNHELTRPKGERNCDQWTESCQNRFN
jgi:hypothetical protein